MAAMSTLRRIKRVLIANRGEIALRIVRSLKDLGIEPIAVYSAADRLAPHVRACALALPVGPAPAAESYLVPAAILAAAHAAQADAIHPGYGFLSENADFAEAVTDAGLLFIGPPAAAMRIMSTKTTARSAMQAVGVPVVPGSEGKLESVAAAAAAAQRMGYPIMLKASAGGGGKGMRIVTCEADLASAFRAATSEAQNAFGDGSIYLEKALLAPRHIEIQIFSDADGKTMALGERECSLQRRHQKVIEEAPSAVLTPSLRAAMEAVACRAATAVDYRGAGTVEFLLDGERDFYFLEMNTRLQVEHPVTEMCFGIDLVAAQVQVAAGAPLPWTASTLQSRGHAIEARIYAEDPAQNFVPSPGTVTDLALPGGPNVRVDSGIAAGLEVSRHYDPLVAKVIAWGPDREVARRRLLRALGETRVAGIPTNLSTLRQLLACPPFVTGVYHTGTVADEVAAAAAPLPAAATELVAMAAAIQQLRRAQLAQPLPAAAAAAADGWRTTAWAGRGF